MAVRIVDDVGIIPGNLTVTGTLSTVNGTSQQWATAITNIQTISGDYATRAFTDAKYLALSGGTVVGNLGVGTFQPSSKLTVVGNVSATGTTYSQSITFPDSTVLTSSLIAASQLQSTGYNNGGISLYTFTSGDTLMLSATNVLSANPVNGGRLVIDGVVRQFNGGLFVDSTLTGVASAINYVYAYWTGSTIALELSTAGHSTQYTNPWSGLEVMTGNPSRTLVGMVYLNGDKKILNNNQNRHVLNWYNRKQIFLGGQIGADAFNPADWGDYTVKVNDPPGSAQYNSLNPSASANWKEIGGTGDNIISYLQWGASLGRTDANILGISGSAWIVNQAPGDRLRLRVGTEARGPISPITSDSSITGLWNWTLSAPLTSFHDAHCISTIGTGGTDSRQRMLIWGQMVGSGRAYVAVNSFAAVWG